MSYFVHGPFMRGLINKLETAQMWATICMSFYGWQMYKVADWVMGRPDLSPAQSAFVSTIYGVSPLLLNFYLQVVNKDVTKSDTVSLTATAKTS